MRSRCTLAGNNLNLAFIVIVVASSFHHLTVEANCPPATFTAAGNTVFDGCGSNTKYTFEAGTSPGTITVRNSEIGGFRIVPSGSPLTVIVEQSTLRVMDIAPGATATGINVTVLNCTFNPVSQTSQVFSFSDGTLEQSSFTCRGCRLNNDTGALPASLVALNSLTSVNDITIEIEDTTVSSTQRRTKDVRLVSITTNNVAALFTNARVLVSNISMAVSAEVKRSVQPLFVRGGIFVGAEFTLREGNVLLTTVPGAGGSSITTSGMFILQDSQFRASTISVEDWSIYWTTVGRFTTSAKCRNVEIQNCRFLDASSVSFTEYAPQLAAAGVFYLWHSLYVLYSTFDNARFIIRDSNFSASVNDYAVLLDFDDVSFSNVETSFSNTTANVRIRDAFANVMRFSDGNITDSTMSLSDIKLTAIRTSDSYSNSFAMVTLEDTEANGLELVISGPGSDYTCGGDALQHFPMVCAVINLYTVVLGPSSSGRRTNVSVADITTTFSAVTSKFIEAQDRTMLRETDVAFNNLHMATVGFAVATVVSFSNNSAALNSTLIVQNISGSLTSNAFASVFLTLTTASSLINTVAELHNATLNMKAVTNPFITPIIEKASGSMVENLGNSSQQMLGGIFAASDGALMTNFRFLCSRSALSIEGEDGGGIVALDGSSKVLLSEFVVRESSVMAKGDQLTGMFVLSRETEATRTLFSVTGTSLNSVATKGAASVFGAEATVTLTSCVIQLSRLNATLDGEVAAAIGFRDNTTLKGSTSLEIDASNITSSSKNTSAIVFHDRSTSVGETIEVVDSIFIGSSSGTGVLFSVGAHECDRMEDLTLRIVRSTLQSNGRGLTLNVCFMNTDVIHSSVTLVDTRLYSTSSNSDAEPIHFMGTTKNPSILQNVSLELLRCRIEVESSYAGSTFSVALSRAQINGFTITAVETRLDVTNTKGDAVGFGVYECNENVVHGVSIDLIRCNTTIKSGGLAAVVACSRSELQGLRMSMIGTNCTAVGGLSAAVIAGTLDTVMKNAEIVVEDVIASTEPNNDFLGLSSFFYYVSGKFEGSSLTMNRVKWTGSAAVSGAATVIGVPALTDDVEVTRSNFTVRGSEAVVTKAGFTCFVGLVQRFSVQNVRFDIVDTSMRVTGKSATIGLVLMSLSSSVAEDIVVNVTRSALVGTTTTTSLQRVLNLIDPVIAVFGVSQMATRNIDVYLVDVVFTATSDVTPIGAFYAQYSNSSGVRCQVSGGVTTARTVSGWIAGVVVDSSPLEDSSFVWNGARFSAETASGRYIVVMNFTTAALDGVDVALHQLEASLLRSDTSTGGNMSIVALPTSLSSKVTVNLSAALVGLQADPNAGFAKALVGDLNEAADTVVSVADVVVNTSTSLASVLVGDGSPAAAEPQATVQLDRIDLKAGLGDYPVISIVSNSGDPTPGSFQRAVLNISVSCVVDVAAKRLLTLPYFKNTVETTFAHYWPLSLDEQLVTCNPYTPTVVVVTPTPSRSPSSTASASISASLIPPLPLCPGDAQLVAKGSPLVIDGSLARGFFYDPTSFGISSVIDSSEAPTIEVDAEVAQKNGVNVSLFYTSTQSDVRFAAVDNQRDPVVISCESDSEVEKEPAIAACEAFLTASRSSATRRSGDALPPFFDLPSNAGMRTLTLLFRPVPSLDPQVPFDMILKVQTTSLRCADIGANELSARIRILPEIPASVQAASAAATANTIVAGVSAAASPLTVADAQALAVFSLISCSTSDSRYAMRQATRLLSPLSIGPEPEGALVGNLVLILCALAVQGVIMGIIYVKKRVVKSNKLSAADVQAEARFPSLFITFAMLFHQGTTVLSLRLLLDGRVSFVAVVAALLAVSFPWAVFTYSSRLTVPSFGAEMSSKLVFFKYIGVGENWPAAVGGFLRNWLVPVGRWGPPLMRKRFGGPVGAVLPLWVRFAAVPPLQATLVSIVASVPTGTRQGCTAQYCSLIALCLVFGGSVVVVRPYRSRFLNVSQVVSYLLLASILVLQMMRALRPTDYGPQPWLLLLLVLMTIATSLRGLYGYWLMICERCLWRSHGGRVLWNELRDSAVMREVHEKLTHAPGRSIIAPHEVVTNESLSGRQFAAALSCSFGNEMRIISQDKPPPLSNDGSSSAGEQSSGTVPTGIVHSWGNGEEPLTSAPAWMKDDRKKPAKGGKTKSSHELQQGLLSMDEIQGI